MKNVLRSFFKGKSFVKTDSETSDSEATIIDRLGEKNIRELKKNNVTFFYDIETESSYRIEIVEINGEKDVVVSLIPTGLGKNYC